MNQSIRLPFKNGDKVKKVGGDYTFEGEIVSGFFKKSGVIRYVVEDDRGCLHIFSTNQLQLQQEPERS